MLIRSFCGGSVSFVASKNTIANIIARIAATTRKSIKFPLPFEVAGVVVVGAVLTVSGALDFFVVIFFFEQALFAAEQGGWR